MKHADWKRDGAGTITSPGQLRRLHAGSSDHGDWVSSTSQCRISPIEMNGDAERSYRPRPCWSDSFDPRSRSAGERGLSMRRTADAGGPPRNSDATGRDQRGQSVLNTAASRARATCNLVLAGTDPWTALTPRQRPVRKQGAQKGQAAASSSCELPEACNRARANTASRPMLLAARRCGRRAVRRVARRVRGDRWHVSWAQVSGTRLAGVPLPGSRPGRYTSQVSTLLLPTLHPAKK